MKTEKIIAKTLILESGRDDKLLREKVDRNKGRYLLGQQMGTDNKYSIPVDFV